MPAPSPPSGNATRLSCSPVLAFARYFNIPPARFFVFAFIDILLLERLFSETNLRFERLLHLPLVCKGIQPLRVIRGRLV